MDPNDIKILIVSACVYLRNEQFLYFKAFWLNGRYLGGENKPSL